jgi:hypothetical protein
LFNQTFNPVATNQILSGDVTFLKTGKGWQVGSSIDVSKW